MWAAIDQYPANTNDRQLTVVRDAEALEKWDHLIDWFASRHMPRCHAIFVSNEEDTDTTTEHALRFVKSGRLIRCGPLNEEDAIAYVKHRLPGTDEETAKAALKRAVGNTYDVVNFLEKCKVLGIQPSQKATDLLLTTRSADDFVSLLTALRKTEALKAAATVPADDVSRIIGSLDLRLDQLQRLNTCQSRGMSMRDTITTTQIPPFVVLELLPHCQHYRRPDVKVRTEALALTDEAWQEGARSGVLETLVALW